MLFSKEKPPIYQACVDKFGVNWNTGVIFTYGQTIHCKFKVLPQKIAHESIHVVQQFKDPELWWNKYLSDPEFRLTEELMAYRAEIQWIKKNIRDYKMRMNLFEGIAKDLSGPMYGNLVLYDDAKNLLNIN